MAMLVYRSVKKHNILSNKKNMPMTWSLHERPRVDVSEPSFIRGNRFQKHQAFRRSQKPMKPKNGRWKRCYGKKAWNWNHHLAK